MAPLTPFNAPLTLKVLHLISGNCDSRFRASNGMHCRTDLPAAEFTQNVLTMPSYFASRPLASARGGQAGTTCSYGDVPRHTPHAVPDRSQFSQQKWPTLLSLWVELSGGDARGERRPPAVKEQPQVGSTSVPLRDIPPPSRQFSVGIGTGATAWSRPKHTRRTSAHAADCDYARLRPRSCGRAQPRQGRASAPRPRRDARP